MVAFRIIPGMRMRMMTMEIIIIYTCPPSHEHNNPRLLRGLYDSSQRRMLTVHHSEDQTAYRLLQLMMIMFQCFIGFPMCVIISQCLLTFHNFTAGLAAVAPTNNYDRVVFHQNRGVFIPSLSEKIIEEEQS